MMLVMFGLAARAKALLGRLAPVTLFAARDRTHARPEFNHRDGRRLCTDFNFE
jgi:hypothetical protein